ncbi:HAD-IB family hydrolase [Dactylosporangium aurantiacum]|uniref:HAD-IB family hydrolase n=2 Tax=Dactylosporangium aurantiacum TaxID=35754 RepID=A0A9Q9MMA6_9ACTN|nr:HAD-IB family hydrolase [Dactylosporangium aurantiacum]
MFEFLAFYLVERLGPAGRELAASVRRDLLAQAAAGVPRAETNRAYYRAWTGAEVRDVVLAGRRWFDAGRRRPAFFHADVLAALRAHRAAGAHLVLVSGAFAPIVEPIARSIGARHVEVTRLEVRDGRYTGELLGPPVIGEVKGERVRALLHAYPAVPAEDCYAYGDHISDLPMLAEVGHPVIVGDDPALPARLPGAPVLAGAMT